MLFGLTCRHGELSLVETKFTNLELPVNEMYSIALPQSYLWQRSAEHVNDTLGDCSGDGVNHL